MDKVVMMFESELFQNLFMLAIWVCCFSLGALLFMKITGLGGIKLETIAARVLLMFAVPLLSGAVHGMIKVIPPMPLTIVIWVIAGYFITNNAIKNTKEQEALIKEKGYWLCKNCNMLNNNMAISCFSCNEPQEQEKSPDSTPGEKEVEE